MRNKVDVKGIIPKGEMVLLRLEKIPNYSKSGIILSDRNKFRDDPNNPMSYMGKVIAIGDKVKQVSVGDYALFSFLSGYHIFTFDSDVKKDDIFKIVEEDNLLVYSKMSGMKVENVMTLGDRILVDIKEVKEELKTKSGVIIPNTVGEGDARQRDLSRGKIIKLSDVAFDLGYRVGDIVYFPKDVGLTIDDLKGDGDYRIIKPIYIKFEYRP